MEARLRQASPGSQGGPRERVLRRFGAQAYDGAMRRLSASILVLFFFVAAVASCSASGQHDTSAAGVGGGAGVGGNHGANASSSSAGAAHDGGGDACKPTTCAAGMCGMVGDGCGGMLDCGSSCPAGQTCGGGGTPNVCGPNCTPKTCMD